MWSSLSIKKSDVFAMPGIAARQLCFCAPPSASLALTGKRRLGNLLLAIAEDEQLESRRQMRRASVSRANKQQRQQKGTVVLSRQSRPNLCCTFLCRLLAMLPLSGILCSRPGGGAGRGQTGRTAPLSRVSKNGRIRGQQARMAMRVRLSHPAEEGANCAPSLSPPLPPPLPLVIAPSQSARRDAVPLADVT